MKGKLLGGILLIIGTSLGGGMLGLPIATAPGGLIGGVGMLIVAWAVMTLGALFILEVNLWLPIGSNIISMANATLGRSGRIVAWFLYLGLLYTLLSAYTASGSDVFRGLLSHVHLYISNALAASIFVILLATIVFLGIRAVDHVNRGLMFAKLIVYALLIALVLPFIHFENIKTTHPRYILNSTMMVLTAFGFATIIPSLCHYFRDNLTKLRLAIYIGSIVPLILYIIWITAIIGILPHTGSSSLMQIKESTQPVSATANAVSLESHSIWVTTLINFFSSICVFTSFLAVSLGLVDFLADGLKLQKKGKQGAWLFMITFLPPLFIVIVYPKAFLLALNYAGLLCVGLLVLLPALMVWRGRYHLQLGNGHFKVPGGRGTLLFLIIISLTIVISSMVFQWY